MNARAAIGSAPEKLFVQKERCVNYSNNWLSNQVEATFDRSRNEACYSLAYPNSTTFKSVTFGSFVRLTENTIDSKAEFFDG